MHQLKDFIWVVRTDLLWSGKIACVLQLSVRYCGKQFWLRMRYLLKVKSCLIFARSPTPLHPATLLPFTELQLIHSLHKEWTVPTLHPACPNAFPPSLSSQFETIADTSDSSSSVTLKSYTMHFEVESLARRVARCVMCQLREGISHCMFLLVGECLLPGHANWKKGCLLASPCCASLGQHSGSPKSLNFCLLTTFFEKIGVFCLVGFFFSF